MVLTIDLAPTLLEFAGRRPLPGMDGPVARADLNGPPRAMTRAVRR